MAKQTKQASAPAPAAAPTTPKTPAATDTPKAFGKPPGDKDVFKRILGTDGKGVPPITNGIAVKLAPQAMVILNLIEAHPNGISRKDLLDKLPAAGLVTRQPVGRILSYYQKAITTETGCCTLEKIAS